MFTRIKNYIAMALMISVLGTFVACNDDDPVTDEWTATYVYLKRVSLASDVKSFNIIHTSDGILNTDNITTPVTVGVSKPFSKDVLVKINVTTSENFPAQAVVLGAQANGSGNTITIPAGKLDAETTLSLNTDWAFAGDKADTYEITLNLEVLTDGDLRVSPKQNTTKIIIQKSDKTDVMADAQPTGPIFKDRSTWKFWAVDYNADPATTNWGNERPRREAFDDNGDTYVWFGNPDMSMKVDFGEIKTLSGMQIYVMFGSAYSMRSCEIYASEDNSKWTTVTPENGLKVTQGKQQYVSFLKQVKARYVIVCQHGNYPLCSEWYFYGIKE